LAAWRTSVPGDYRRFDSAREAKTDGDSRDKWPDADQDKGKPAEGEFPDVDRCWVIIGDLEDECSRQLQKVRLREVCAAASSISRKLK